MEVVDNIEGTMLSIQNEKQTAVALLDFIFCLIDHFLSYLGYTGCPKSSARIVGELLENIFLQ